MSCSDLPTPSFIKECDDPADTVVIDGVCIVSSAAYFEQKGKELCFSMSNGEYEYDPVASIVEPCLTDPQRNGIELTTECVTTIPIKGTKIFCRRKEFKASPLECCLQDAQCNEASDACYTDGRKSTCAPEYRNTAGAGCRLWMQAYISGNLPGDTYSSVKWLDRWTSDAPFIPNILARAIYPSICEPLLVPGELCSPENLQEKLTLSGVVYPDAEGYKWVRDTIVATIRHYKDNGFVLGAFPGTTGYHILQTILYTYVCCVIPGACELALETSCYGYSAQRIDANPELAKFCGCHMNPSIYLPYSAQYNIQPECQPICNNVPTLKRTNGKGQIIDCDKTICLIDNSTVSILNSTVAGGIQFNNVCGNCKDASCACIIASNTIEIINGSEIKGSIINSNKCGKIMCQVPNPDPTGLPMIEIPCEDNPGRYFDDLNTAKSAKDKSNSQTRQTIAIVMIFILLFLMIAIVFILRNRLATDTIGDIPPSYYQYKKEQADMIAGTS